MAWMKVGHLLAQGPGGLSQGWGGSGWPAWQSAAERGRWVGQERERRGRRLAPLLAVAADEVGAVAQAEEEGLLALQEELAVDPALREDPHSSRRGPAHARCERHPAAEAPVQCQCGVLGSAVAQVLDQADGPAQACGGRGNGGRQGSSTRPVGAALVAQ